MSTPPGEGAFRSRTSTPSGGRDLSRAKCPPHRGFQRTILSNSGESELNVLNRTRDLDETFDGEGKLSAGVISYERQDADSARRRDRPRGRRGEDGQGHDGQGPRER